MIYGLDCLGLAKYSGVVAKEIPNNWALGCFASQFGDVIPHLNKVLLTGKVPIVRVHLLWKDNHAFTAKDIPLVQREARRFVPIINKFPGIEFRISPTCEHKMSTALAERFIGATRTELPTRVIMVNTPMAGGAILPGITNEFHGNKAKPFPGHFDFSFDGDAAEDSDVEGMKARMKDCDTFYIWGPRFNGRWETKDPTPIKLRKGWPDAEYIRSLSFLSKQKGMTSVRKGDLLKSHAENKGDGDWRAEKPVYITDSKTSKIEMRTKDGLLVTTLKYYGTFSGGGFRYYSPEWGYKSAEKALKLSGSPLTDIYIDNKKVGVCNLGFRDPTFR